MADRRFHDEETAPLLRDPDAEDAASENPEPTWADKLNSIAQEPLTPLTKFLLVLTLVLLLLSSIFIGLFAGVQHKLALEKGRHEDEHPASTITVTATSTRVSTSTSVFTTTAVPPGPTSAPDEPPCITSDCIVLSASILSSLDTTQDPCENFYEFANGGWLKAHPLPSDKSSVGSFEILAEQNMRVIQDIMENPSSTPTFATSYDEEILKKLRGFYSSCTNEDRLDDIGMEPLLHFAKTVRRLYRGDDTDITSSSDDEGKKNGFTAALAFLHSRGVPALFDFDIDGDVGVDPNFMTLTFSQSSLGLPSKEYYEDKSVRKLYKGVLERLLLTLSDEDEKLLQKASSVLVMNSNAANLWPPWPWPPWGDDDDDKDDDKKPNKTEIAHKMAKKVVKFERKLAKASLDLDILYQDPIATYNRWPLSNLTATLPQINFANYFTTFTPRAFPEYVIVTSPDYAVSLAKILEETPSEVVEAFLVVRAALTLSPNLGTATEAWLAQRSLVEALTGIKKGAVGDRAEYCVGKVDEAMGFATGRYFVNETFGGASQEKATRVITDIIKAFKAGLPQIPWMDKESADAAAEKADAIRVKVGFPISPDTKNPGSIARYYSTVKVNEGDYFGNVLSSITSEKFRTWLQLGKQRNPDEFIMTPATVNAAFNPPANEIIFPAGILQPPFFSQDWPSYLAYGAFGHVAGHELTHAFDSAGRLYNQQGKLEDWWTNASSAAYNEKQECIVKQFSAYTIDDGKGGEAHVNGNLTSGENIGDTGLLHAYRAWEAQFESSFETGNEFLLPGLNYTRQQLFFISFARIMARSMKPAAAIARLRTDPHSPTIYRVNGVVYNIPEFAKAFHCSKTAKLNPPPEKQCRFWS